MNITATVKGVITGLVMVLIGILIYSNRIPDNSPIQYAGYLVYGLGIVWSIVAFVKQKNGMVTFAMLFNQGFRCFIVVTLMMALFTLLFYKINHQIIEEKAVATRQELLKTEKNRTAQEIDTMIETGKKNFPLIAASGAIFQYLFIGAIVTMAISGALYLRNKNT